MGGLRRRCQRRRAQGPLRPGRRDLRRRRLPECVRGTRGLAQRDLRLQPRRVVRRRRAGRGPPLRQRRGDRRLDPKPGGHLRSAAPNGGREDDRRGRSPRRAPTSITSGAARTVSPRRRPTGHSTVPARSAICSRSPGSATRRWTRLLLDRPGARPGRGRSVTIHVKPYGADATPSSSSPRRHAASHRYWGTSDTNPGGGPGWIPESAFDASYLAGFQPRHPPGL